MARVSVQVIRRAAQDLKEYSRTYSNVNRNYTGLVPYPTAPAMPYVPTIWEGEDSPAGTPTQITKYADWVNRVMRSIGMLGEDTYVDSNIQAGFSANEEIYG